MSRGSESCGHEETRRQQNEAEAGATLDHAISIGQMRSDSYRQDMPRSGIIRSCLVEIRPELPSRVYSKA